MNKTILIMALAAVLCCSVGCSTSRLPPKTTELAPGNPLIDSNEFHRRDIKLQAHALAKTAQVNLRQLEEALLFNNETVRWAAQDALVSLGAYAVPVLVKVLKTGDRRAKEHACNALQIIGIPAAEAIPVLIESIGDDVSVANYAARALSTVGLGSAVARDGLKEAQAKGVQSAGAVNASLKIIEESLTKVPEQSHGEATP